MLYVSYVITTLDTGPHSPFQFPSKLKVETCLVGRLLSRKNTGQPLRAVLKSKQS